MTYFHCLFFSSAQLTKNKQLWNHVVKNFSGEGQFFANRPFRRRIIFSGSFCWYSMQKFPNSMTRPVFISFIQKLNGGFSFFVCVCVCAPLCAGKSVLISNLSISVLLLLLRIVRVIPYHLYNFQSPFLFKLKQPDLYKQYVKLWNFDHKCKKNNKIFLYTAELNFWRTPKIYYAAKFQKNVLNSYN